MCPTRPPFPDKAPGYYAVFATSPALRQTSETLLHEVASGNWRQQAVLLEVIRLFNQEAAQAYVLDAIERMQLAASAQRFVHSALDTMRNTINRLAAQVVPKLGEAQMQQAALHVQALTLAVARDGTALRAYTGYRLPEALEQERQSLSQAIRAGDWHKQRQRSARLLSALGDLMLDEVYLKAVQLMGLGFLSEKMVQAGLGVTRTVLHQLVNWAVSTLDEAEFREMADFMEGLVLHLPHALPHSWLYFPRD